MVLDCAAIWRCAGRPLSAKTIFDERLGRGGPFPIAEEHYWLLLLSEFPAQRRNLLSFLIRRLRHKPLSWPRHPQEAGELVSSSLRVKISAAISGAMLFLSTPKQRDSSPKR